MRLPKFDSARSLILGAAISALLFVLNLLALVLRWDDPIWPSQVAKLLGMAVGVVLGVHCLDMIRYYRKNGRSDRK